MRKKQAGKRKCVLCGSERRVEANHQGGRKFIAWFTSPLCGDHHDKFHQMLRLAGVDLRYTANRLERIRRVLAATLVFLWMVLEQLKHEIELRERKQGGTCNE